jgi:N-acetylglucosamine kinase-like BadF-type ATPase
MLKRGDALSYFIGIDGGGTKTALCAANIEGSLVRYTRTSSASWREHGVLEVTRKIKKAATELVGDGQIAGIALGVPCYGESTAGDYSLQRALSREFAGIPLYVTNDAEIGWSGSMALKPGINVVAGTGSIAFGKDASGKSARSGGWSEFFGDEGSCFWIGRKILGLFSKQADGRLPKDELYYVIYREFALKGDFDFIDVIHERYMACREQVASLQLFAEKAATAGSQSVIALYKKAVSELCLLIAAVRDKLDFAGEQFIVSYTGGLFKAGELVLPQFSREVEKMGGRLKPPRFAPEEGAVMLACRHFSPDSIQKVEELLQSAKAG